MMNYDSVLSDVVKTIEPSGIRKFFDLASDMEGVISLGVGEPDFVTPWHIRNEGVYALEKGKTHYTANAGFLELRKEISNYIERNTQVSYNPKGEVLVTVGGSEAIDLAIRSIVNPGDEGADSRALFCVLQALHHFSRRCSGTHCDKGGG